MTNVEGMIVMEEAKKFENNSSVNVRILINNYNKLRKIMSSCRTVFPLLINEFDTNNNMFNCQNGTTGFNIDAV